MNAWSLLAQSPWWIVPYVALVLLMLYAMMELTVTILVRRPPAFRGPVPASELRQRLLALNDSGRGYCLVEGQDCDLRPTWDVVDPTWRQQFDRVRLTTVYRAWILLDDSRHELRMHELLRSTNFFLGFNGLRPVFQPYLFLVAGLTGAWTGRAYGTLAGFPPQIDSVVDFAVDTVGLKEAITKVTNRAGWVFRPVNLWFQATTGGFRLLAAITPAFLARMSARRFWGVAYPASFFLAIAYLVVVGEFWETRTLLLIAGISAAWFAVWGFLVWVLMGLPAFWRRR